MHSEAIDMSLSFALPTIIRLQGHTSDVYSCQWNPKADFLVSASPDSSLNIFYFNGDRIGRRKMYLKKPNPSDREAITLDWRSDGQLLATGSCDGYVRIFKAHGDLIAALPQHPYASPLLAVKWSKNGRFILTGGLNRRITLWNADKKMFQQQFNFFPGPVQNVDWCNETCFVASYKCGPIFVGAIGDRRPRCKFLEHTGDVNEMKWNYDSTIFASCSNDKTIKLWSLERQTRSLRTLRGHSLGVKAIDWSPSTPSQLASGSYDKTVKLWDASSGECLRTLTEHNNGVMSVAFSPDGKYVASGAWENDIRVSSVHTPDVVYIHELPSPVHKVCWNHTGDKIAASCKNGSVCILDLRKLNV